MEQSQEYPSIPSKKLTANDAIINMMQAMNLDRKDQFYKTAENYLSTLSRNGQSFHRVKRLISERPKELMRLDELSSGIKRLISTGLADVENVFINDKVKLFLDELLLEWQNSQVYKFHNLPVRNKILLHGATGNGKTTIARHIANEAGLPFVEVNADLVIDSHVGNSGANIYMILSSIKQPCVLFWDEVDTIGRKRGSTDSAAAHENDRMVNSMLINIEKLGSDVIFIGATNRYDILDSAFIRRFDIKLSLPAPSIQEKASFAKQMIEYYKLPEQFHNENILRFDNFSEIKMHFMDLARKYVVSTLNDKKVIAPEVA